MVIIDFVSYDIIGYVFNELISNVMGLINDSFVVI